MIIRYVTVIVNPFFDGTGTFNKNGSQYFSNTIKTNQANSLKFAGDVTDFSRKA